MNTEPIQRLQPAKPNAPEIQAFNAEFLAYVATWGPINFTDLYAAFGDLPATHAGHKRLHNRIQQLAYSGKLVNVGEGRINKWVVGDGASAPLDRRQRNKAGLQRRHEVLQDAEPMAQKKALPRQYDMMRAPVYRPKATACTRPGAMDFARIPSRGHRC